MTSTPDGLAHGAGELRVLALLEATQEALQPFTGDGVAMSRGVPAPTACPATETVRTACQTEIGLRNVMQWLQGAMRSRGLGLSTSSERLPGSLTSSLAAGRDASLAVVLRTGLDKLEAIGQVLEDDPIAQFDAVQAVSLASAVLGAAHQRLQRAGLAQARPAYLLAP